MHPIEETIKRQTYINQNNISHIITSLRWEGNLLYGTIETANTAAGRDFQGLIRQGCQVSFSMRGVGGEVSKKDGYDYIKEGLYILCYDNVPFPSHDAAYMQNIIKENGDTSFTNSEKVLTEGHVMYFKKSDNSNIYTLTRDEDYNRDDFMEHFHPFKKDHENKEVYFTESDASIQTYEENSDRIAFDRFMRSL